MKRSAWHIRANAVVGFWLVAAAVIAVIHRFVPEDMWLMIHLVLLGAVSTAILIWSQHFAQTLLRSPNLAGRRGEGIRLALHTIGALFVVAGMVTAIWPLVVVGGVIVGGNAIWHALAIFARKHRALPARFSHLVRYYLVATLILPVGVSMGVWLARGGLSAADHSRFYISHVSLNLLGWVGITVLGTLVTLWPTALRTQLHERAEKQARRALPILAGGIAVIQVAALTALQWIVPIGVAIYVIGMALIYVPALATGWRKRPGNFATLSLAASGFWLAGCVVTFAISSILSGSWGEIADHLSSLAAPFVVGFGAQVLLGALSYLLPVVLGGGPKMSRRTTEILDGAGPARVVLVNIGLAICLLPVPSLVRVTVSLVVFGALVAFLPKALRAVRTARRGVEALPADEAATDVVPAGVGNAGVKSPLGSFTAAAATLVLAVVLGVAGDPAAVGLGASAADDSVVATGEVTEVEVEMRDMRFWPASIDVPVGNQLIITAVNTDDDVHDLVLDTGDSTGRVAPGAQQVLDVGVVGRSIDGWCSVAGHRQMGMVFDINVIGGDSSPSGEQDNTAAGDGANNDGGMHHGMDGMGHGNSSGTGAASAADDLDLMAEPGVDFERFDPALAPAEDSDGPVTHKVTLEVTEEVEEVAPGIEQTVWKFGDTAPGPTLRGKVGDIFEITLVNDGSLGHSIDFHAGMLAPNEPMRTIAPGETLTYIFTAEHSGIWMYHCSTVPMSLHIANGMFGAVIIDPPDLDEVDHEFIMIQSELYLGPQGEVGDLAKIQADEPDLVVFNGYANQYAYEPIEVGVEDRVRIWVMPVGPNRGTSFHVIGGQFDTVFHEGRYLLRAGETTGASQALGLTTAQGGFVELTFPEIGDYPFVDHVMINAERGAKGLFSVR